MIRFLVKRFIRNYENTQDNLVRERYGMLGSGLGIFCNLLLFIAKLSVGVLMNSIAVISDAFNNLSDLGASLVSLVGIKLSNARPDKEHPYGHGRMEYIASLLVSFLIFYMGIELFKNSVSEIRSPSGIQITTPILLVLLSTVLIKVWMFFANRYLAGQINSGVLKATAQDSLNDVVATSGVILSALLGKYTSWPVDGIAGLLISLMIFRSGYTLAKDTVALLLGTIPSPQVLERIRKILMEQEEIVGVHDLMVHDYGPGRMIATAHAEVPMDSDIVKIHEELDKAERIVLSQLGVHLVIHMDPIITDCEKTVAAKALVEKTVSEVNPELTIHDFRMSGGEETVYLIFDLVVPCQMGKEKRQEIVREIENKVKAQEGRFSLRVQIDECFE